MRILVDMNLSPEWLSVLAKAGFTAVHWKDVGAANAPDKTIFEWASRERHMVLTQDLDFAQLLFATQSAGPSVVLLRLRNELDPIQQERVCRLLTAASAALESGGLLVIDERRARLRRLPPVMT